MSLYKFGAKLKILKMASKVEELVIDRPLVENFVAPTIVEKKDPEFLYFSARAISAGDYGPLDKEGKHTFAPNGNGDFFGWDQLQASYESFVGRSLFLNHESDNPIKSCGKIIDSSLEEDSETGEKFVVCMAKIDKKIHPELARKIEKGELNTVSMGCSCDESVCSICGCTLHSDADQKCAHLSGGGLLKQYTAEVDFPEYHITKGQEIQAFAINKGITFNELSIVNIPADSKAFVQVIYSNLKDRLSKKASLSKEEQLDLIGQMDKLFSKLDEATKEQVKAEFCGCPLNKEEEPNKESIMSEQDEYKQILSKMSAYEFEKLEGYISHKQKKSCAEKAAPIIAKAEEKQESFLQKIVEKAKETVAGKIFSNTVKRLAESELKPKVAIEIPLPSETERGWEHGQGRGIDYSKSTCEKCGDPISEGSGTRCAHCAKARSFVPPITSSLRAEFKKDASDILKSTWAVYDGEKLVLDASMKEIWGDKVEDAAWATSTEYGQAIIARYEDKQLGGVEKLAALWDVAYKLTDVKNSKVEEPAKSEFIKPEEKTKADKEHEKSSEAVETKYEVKEEEVKKEAAEVKTEEVKVEAAKMSEEAQKFIKKHIKKHKTEDKMEQDQAVRVAYEEARKKGYDVPEAPKSASVEFETLVKEAIWPFNDKETDELGKDVTPNPLYQFKPNTRVAITDKKGKEYQGTILFGSGPGPEDASAFYRIKLDTGKEIIISEDEHPDLFNSLRKVASMLDNKNSIKKEADAYVEDPILEVKPEETLKSEDLPHEEPEVKPIEEPKPELAPEVPKLEEVPISAFDKLDGKIDVGEGYEALKDKETKEIVISKEGKEIKRLPDGFGDDVPTVLKLLRAVLGLPELGEEKKEPVVEPKPEEALAEHETETMSLEPIKEEPKVEDPFAAKESALKVKEEELNKRAEEIKQKEAAVAAQKFSALVNARSERCRRIVEAMFEKELLAYDEQTFDSELESGKAVLDARKVAVKAAVNKKVRELLAMTDETLVSTEKTVEEAKIPSSTKKATYIPNLSYRAEIGAEEEISAIFRSMGTLKNK